MSKTVPITSVAVGQEFKSKYDGLFTRAEDCARWPELIQVINSATGKRDVFGRGIMVEVENDNR